MFSFKELKKHFSFLAWTAMSNHFWSQRSREKAAKSIKHIAPLQVPFKSWSICLKSPWEFDPVGADLQRKDNKDNQGVLWELEVEAKLAAESAVGIGLWMSFDLWKLDLDGGRTKRWSMMATQGSRKGHRDATHKDTAQQTNLSTPKHVYWTSIKSLLHLLSCRWPSYR